MLEQLLGSVQAHCYKQWAVKLYTEKIPANIEIPSMYFPPPSTNDDDFSKDAFSKLYTQRVLCRMHSDTAALLKAEEIADSIRKNDYSVPVLNEDGTETGKTLHFSRISASIIADYTAQITMIFEVQDYYEE